MINDLLEQLQTAYMTNRWARIAARVGLLLSGILLLWLSGGFPPWAWRLLFQVMLQVPRLWAVHGLLIVFPLVGLILLSATLLFAWGAFVLAGIRLIRDWWQERQELRKFNEEVLEAQYLSEAAQEDLDASPFSQRHAMPATATSANASVNGASGASSRRYQQVGARYFVPQHKFIVPHEDISLVHTPVMVRDRAKTRDDVRPGSEPDIPRYSRPAVLGPRLQTTGKTKKKGGIYLDIGTGLDAGIKRRGSPNEDSLLAVENITRSATAPQPVGLFIVADGMGGHGNGHEASQLAIRSMRESVLMALQLGVEEDDMLAELLVEGLQNANRSVYKHNQQQHADMGTTMTAVLLWGPTAYVVNVGDSRTYMYREPDGLYQVTRDHSIVARLVEHGAITADQVYTHPKRNEIYRSLGNHPSVEVDTFTVPVRVGDVLLLCSDGLWEMVRDFEIEEIVRASIPYSSQICAMLVQAALNRGGKDNISVIALCVRED
jgi:serine/threonine protein phosphatase PrpC